MGSGDGSEMGPVAGVENGSKGWGVETAVKRDQRRKKKQYKSTTSINASLTPDFMGKGRAKKYLYLQGWRPWSTHPTCT